MRRFIGYLLLFEFLCVFWTVIDRIYGIAMIRDFHRVGAISEPNRDFATNFSDLKRPLEFRRNGMFIEKRLHKLLSPVGAACQ